MQNLTLPPTWNAINHDQTLPGRHVLLGVARVLAATQSPVQHILLGEVPGYGLGLFLDGNVQLLEVDEAHYHERLALLPTLLHPAPRRVLIVGGGDGLAAREVLRDQRVEHVTMVEYDAAVVELCRQHLARLHQGSLNNSRLHIDIADARLFLQQPNRFDVAIIDLVDCYAAEDVELYREVLSLLPARLAPGGLISTHGDISTAPWRPGLQLLRLLRKTCAWATLEQLGLMSYSAVWGFILAGFDGAPPAAERLAEQAAALATPPQTWLPTMYPAAWQPTPALQQALAQLPQLESLPPAGETAWVQR
ncbi:MAG: hypothetical protein MUD01_10635 [Chloroflexaceae bacterium]|jgi:spermidine synthase|nr:hypothetical protein [Chloroflexaceae bacterium]